MKYMADFSDEFLKIAKKLKKNDIKLFKRLESKIDEILERPEHYKPLKGNMKGLRRVHIGSFVILFEIKTKYLKFVTFKHHDKAYI
ncbi:MAG: type II toxin-antitoxin system mRNA interferase toxin, RelE/StbE family [Candidatus Aenigmatarchaeota archaeon]|nr:MAG: type II toxin-antitoxin system mRNA interferase toxin, RelE/StbE family [Candidatus Aenigmarchaeota archaeon]